jgi:uncharacterized protein YndB with AHSA1/START domain
MMDTMIEQTMDSQDVTKDIKLEITRVIRASRQRVFDAWTRPEYVRQWFSPGGNRTVQDATMDFRVGGSYRLQMQGANENCDGSTVADRTPVATGTYKKVVPHELLVFTWNLNRDDSGETLVTVAFRDVEGGTEVRLTHERFATETMRDQHETGWTSVLASLDGYASGS